MYKIFKPRVMKEQDDHPPAPEVQCWRRPTSGGSEGLTILCLRTGPRQAPTLTFGVRGMPPASRPRGLIILSTYCLGLYFSLIPWLQIRSASRAMRCCSPWPSSVDVPSQRLQSRAYLQPLEDQGMKMLSVSRAMRSCRPWPLFHG